MKQPIPLTQVKKILGIRFRRMALLEAALEHSSYLPEKDKAAEANFDRLEFFGDAILGFVICQRLYKLFPEANEGELSRLRSILVSRKFLARIGRNLKLWRVIRLGRGMQKQAGLSREKILADTLEALIAAIYLDRGLETAKRFILKHFSEYFNAKRLLRLDPNPKSSLQELAQKNWRRLPVYASRQGKKGIRTEIVIHSKLKAIAYGKTRKAAEETAARTLIRKARQELSRRSKKTSSAGKLRKTL